MSVRLEFGYLICLSVLDFLLEAIRLVIGFFRVFLLDRCLGFFRVSDR